MNIPVHRYTHLGPHHVADDDLTVVLGVGEYADEGESAALVTIEVYSHPVDPDADPADYVEQAVAAVRGALAGSDPHGLISMRDARAERDLAALPPAGATLIAIDRQRQYTAEGYIGPRDDEYVHGEIGCAAVAYLLAGLEPAAGAPYLDINETARSWWPWHPEYFKPDPADRVRTLVKAGALIAAEIDRLNRIGKAR